MSRWFVRPGLLAAGLSLLLAGDLPLGGAEAPRAAAGEEGDVVPVLVAYYTLTQVRQFGSQKCVNARICAGRGGGVCPYTRPEPGGLEATAGQHGTDRHQQVARRPGGGNDTRSAWQRIARRDVKSTSVVF